MPNETKNLYHYTSLEGLKGIISNDSFFFTNSLSLNDRSEGKEIFSVLSEVLETIEISNKFYSRLNNLTWKTLIEVSELNFYVLSLCEDRDNLTMWNYYTKSSNSLGVNLVLDLKELAEKFVYYLDEEIPVRTDNLNWWHTYGSVIYDDNEKYRILKSIIEITDAEIKRNFNEDIFSQFLSIFRVLSIFFKNQYFKVGNEYRFVIALSMEQLTTYIQQRKKDEQNKSEKIEYRFRASNGTIQPYLNVPLLKKWNYPHIRTLKNVVLTPAFDENSTDGIRALLDFHRYNYTEIFKSQMPLR